jgi:hypothetical protein
MKHCLLSILAPFAAGLSALIAATPAAAAGEIVVAAQETTIVVAQSAARTRLVNLPTLKFGLRAAFKCTGEPVSVTLSIADTYATLHQDQLAGLRAAEATLTVPPSQLALAASNRFCRADDPDTADELLIPGLVTAHASLRCSDDEGDSVHFASAPLQVRLICERQPDEAQAPSEAPATR